MDLIIPIRLVSIIYFYGIKKPFFNWLSPQALFGSRKLGLFSIKFPNQRIFVTKIYFRG